MTFRHFLSWKPLFYEGLLPALRCLGPARGDAILGALGRVWARADPLRRRQLSRAIARGRVALGTDWDRKVVRPALAANAMRFLARDYPLDVADDAEALSRFDVDGFDALREALDRGRGAIVVGSHLGGHIAALHWLYRREVPLRLLVQRPRHVSRTLDQHFDRDEPHPQSGFFLRRDLPPAAATERLLRARAALRDGLAVYLAGDIPWAGPNSRPGRLVGQAQSFLAVWADLAAVTRAPVFFLFCTHRPDGRYHLQIDPPRAVASGEEGAAVVQYLARLEAMIAAHPADAVAHLLWPCYGAPSPAVANGRPSHRIAVARP